jgi:signal transduction histidine kinase
MKLTKKLETEILKVYNTYWDAYFKGDMKVFASMFDENCIIIGSSENEVFYNKKTALKFYKATAGQVVGKAGIQNKKITLRPVDNNILVIEQSDFYVLLDDKWSFYGNGRISTLLHNTDNGWKIIHEHGSLPDSKAGEGEQISIDKIKAENVKLQIAVKKRTFELEQKNKELEIAIANLKSTQSQLIHSEKMASLGELTAGIAHEIKNPLNFVNNFSEISSELLDEIKEELEKNDKEEVLAILENLKQNLEKINQHGKRADSIVKGMLLHSRGSSGEKTPTDINELLEQYVNLAYHGMRAQDKEFNIKIEREYDKTLEKINVVPQDISRVFLNIINNACYAANEKKKKSGSDFSPTLKVSTKNLKDKFEIRIVDNGNGIPSEILDKIFQPFFTTKPTGEGTGLGLSLSYDIITQEHGGTLKLDKEVSDGASFIITLPK